MSMPSPRMIAREPSITPAHFLAAWAVLTLVCGMAMLAGANGLILMAVVLAVPGCMALFAWPDMATLAVLFVLYTNAAVVAVRFHGVPYAVGAAVPLLLALPLGRYFFSARENLVVTPVLPLVGLFVLVQMFATLFSADPGISTAVLIGTMIEGLGLYFLITNVVRTLPMLRYATWVLLAAGAMMGTLSILQQATGNYDNDYGGFAQMSNAAFGTGEQDPSLATQRRLAGPLGDQNRYAQIMLMLVPLGFFRFTGESKRWLRIAAGASTAVISVGLALAFSRGAAVAFVLMLITMVFLRYISWRQCTAVLVGVALVAFAVPQYATRLVTLEKISAAVVDDTGAGIAGADSAVRSRYTEMMGAALMFFEHPLTGVGPGLYPAFYHEYAERVGGNIKDTARQPHTLYIGVAAEMGLPGLVTFMAIVGVALVSLSRVRRQCLEEAPEWADIISGFILAIVAYLATALFLHLAYARYFWLVLALAGAAEVIVRRELARNSIGASPNVERPIRRRARLA